MRGKIVLLCPEKYREPMLEMTGETGVDLQWVDSKAGLPRRAAMCRDAVAVIAIPSAFPAELARECPQLRLIQVVSAGTDMMDLRALGEMGIRVANNGGGNAASVAEHTIALMISVYRKLHLQFRSVQEKKWAGELSDRWSGQAHELTGKTVGIVGAGRIGREVARRLHGWDCALVYSDVFPLPPEDEQRLNLTRVSFEELLATSDVVTLHVPLIGNTRGMVGERELARMKPSAILINACRGAVVDESALVSALRGGALAGAGLDVLEQEPTPPENPLLAMENVVVTPHMASFSQESWEKSRRFAIENAARVASGEEPLSVVRPE